MCQTHPDSMTDTDMTPDQCLYYYTHGTIKGVCMCGCGKETEWNYKTGKPYKLSPDPACRKRVFEKADRNYKAIHGVSRGEMMKSAEEQKRIQQNRPTHGTYKFQDGGEISYLSKLELSFLKFVDQTMELPSRCIIEAPQSFPYFDEQSKTNRIYMPDYYLPDYNLIVEIKEGGAHANENPEYIKETKYKEYYKDEVMRHQKQFNFIKIVDNKFGPFIEILFHIVQTKSAPTNKKKQTVLVVTESACTAIMDLPTSLYETFGDMYLIVNRDSNGIVNRVSVSLSQNMDNVYTECNGVLSFVSSAYLHELNESQNISYYKYFGDAEAKNDLLNRLSEYAEIKQRITPMSLYSYLLECGIFFPLNSGDYPVTNFVKLDCRMIEKERLL